MNGYDVKNLWMHADMIDVWTVLEARTDIHLAGFLSTTYIAVFVPPRYPFYSLKFRYLTKVTLRTNPKHDL